MDDMQDAGGTGDSAPMVSRRRFGRAVLLGGVAAGAVSAVADPSAVGAAPVTDTWKLGGNSGVTEATNFLGTKDNRALVIRTNNTERMRVAATGRVAVGAPPPLTLESQLSSQTSAAIYGFLAKSGFDGIFGTGSRFGVRGNSAGGAFGAGVYGDGGNVNPGVEGYSISDVGVFGRSPTGDGVHGVTINGGALTAGVRGEGQGANSNGVVGIADNGAGAWGVWGKSAGGFAGTFSGRVQVTGMLSKGGGSFKIDHPLDPDNRYLSHSFVESPDMMNVYNGNIRTNGKGEATITLPDYFEALNSEFRYQLTPIGQFAQAIVATEISSGSFTIKTDKPNVKVSWQVTGIRQDAFARANRIQVAEDKPADERGTRLHPEAFGLAETAGVHHPRYAAMRSAAPSESRSTDPATAQP